MTLESFRIPGQPYGGSGMWSFRDAVGAIWFVYSGKNPDGVFKQQVARYFNNKWKWYDVPVQFHARPTASIEPSGLYITYQVNEAGNEIRRWKVPDFVMPGYPTDGQSAPVPPTPPVEMVDSTARANSTQNRQLIDALTASNAKTDAEQKAQIAALQNQVAELQRRPSGGVTEGQVADIVWAKSPDAIYNDLQNHGGIYGQIQAIVDKALKDRGL